MTAIGVGDRYLSESDRPFGVDTYKEQFVKLSLDAFALSYPTFGHISNAYVESISTQPNSHQPISFT
ncbi:MAG: hypothetical protein AB4426_16515 [Xenococcaceae cyanobacterium]